MFAAQKVCTSSSASVELCKFMSYGGGITQMQHLCSNCHISLSFE